MRREIGLAVVGSGRIGSLRARLGSEHPAVSFLAVADRDEGMARNLADTVGADLWSGDNSEIISHPKVTSVIVATSEGEHVEPALEALRLGKSVLVEKPIALTLVDADRILAAAATSDAELRVGVQSPVSTSVPCGKRATRARSDGNPDWWGCSRLQLTVTGIGDAWPQSRRHAGS